MECLGLHTFISYLWIYDFLGRRHIFPLEYGLSSYLDFTVLHQQPGEFVPLGIQISSHVCSNSLWTEKHQIPPTPNILYT